MNGADALGPAAPLPTALLDAALRGALVATLLILAVALARERGPRPMAIRTVLGLLAGLMVQTVASTPMLERGVPLLWQAPLVGLSVGNSALFWLFARSVFDDDFRLRLRHAAVWAFVVAIGASYLVSLAVVGPEPTITHALRLALRWLPAGFVALVIAAAVWKWRGDLVERRRRLRSFIVIAGTAYTASIVWLRLDAAHGMLSPTAAGFDTAALLVIVFVSAASVLRAVDGGGLIGPANAPATAAATRPGGDVSVDTTTTTTQGGEGTGRPPAPPDPKQAQLADALDRLMRQDRVYRIDDLTLGLLALKLGVPEYRLRRCIHERLGFRNFNAYVNALRLEQAQQALADPAERTTSVAEIAMNAGFASIGPFNRAFKAATGLTPSEFRQRALADS